MKTFTETLEHSSRTSSMLMSQADFEQTRAIKPCKHMSWLQALLQAFLLPASMDPIDLIDWGDRNSLCSFQELSSLIHVPEATNEGNAHHLSTHRGLFQSSYRIQCHSRARLRASLYQFRAVRGPSHHLRPAQYLDKSKGVSNVLLLY